MVGAVNKFFWGLVLIFFNINIGFIDILPDFIGYILIASAFAELQKYVVIAEKGIIWAWIALGFQVFAKGVGIQGEWPLIYRLLGFCFQITQFCMIYCLCETLYDLLGKVGQGVILKKSQNFEAVSEGLTSNVLMSGEKTHDECCEKQLSIKSSWNVYMYTSLMSIGLSTFSMNQVQEVMGLVAIVGVIHIIIIVILMLKVRNIKYYLKGYPIE